MKALVRLLCIGSLLAAGAYGQRGGFGGFGGVHGGGFGGGGFHTGFGGFHGGFGGFRGGHGVSIRAFPFFGAGFGNRFGFGGFGAGFWGYPYAAYPAYYDPGFYDGDYDNGYAPYAQAAPNVTVLYMAPPPAPPAPPPPPPAPEVNDYHWDNSSPTVHRQVFFQVALKDGTVLRALAYWVDDDTFHYIDENGRKGTTPLENIDRGRSIRMNRDRAIEFGLPETE